MSKTIIIPVNDAASAIASTISSELRDSETVTLDSFRREHPDCDAIIFVGALGICVRAILPHIHNKYVDPAVVCVDTTGRFAISVLSGHVGGANDLTRFVASILGAEAVVTTQSDNIGRWPLDTLADRFGWTCTATKAEMRQAIYTFVGDRPCALLLEVRDRGTEHLERSLPDNVTIIDADSPLDDYELLIAVTPRRLPTTIPTLQFIPRVLTLGIGCRRDCPPEGIPEYIRNAITDAGFRPEAVGAVATIELKRNEPLIPLLCEEFGIDSPSIFTASELAPIAVPNPSDRVREATGVASVSESAAIASAGGGPLIIEKTKCRLSEGADFTFALAEQLSGIRKGLIEIVGAGPGDPELVSVRGRRLLESADLILYAGSLVPRELTFYAKAGCVVRSSASLTLEEQFALMKDFYDRGLLVVRLHTGDPCIYGAIQEQMAFFDRHHMDYHITPGISSFQAAAAELRSQFTIPERVQTIILTRGEGRTPMPEREQLSRLARSQSTMCIYLSAGVVDDVQRQLLESYPPETPVAACYKLTWRDQRIYRGVLRDLARIVHDNNLTLTTLLVVGDAIDNRRGLSRLYSHEFSHLFRK